MTLAEVQVSGQEIRHCPISDEIPYYYLIAFLQNKALKAWEKHVPARAARKLGAVEDVVDLKILEVGHN